MPAAISRIRNIGILTTKYGIRNEVTGEWRNGSNSLRQVLKELGHQEVAYWYDIDRGWIEVPASITNRLAHAAGC